MEVILKEDVNKLGHRGDVVKVADGYGRNFLLPQKLAMEATAANKVVIEQMKQAAVRQSAHRIKGAASMVGATHLASLAAGLEMGGDKEAATPVVLNNLLSACNELERMLLAGKFASTQGPQGPHQPSQQRLRTATTASTRFVSSSPTTTR